MTRPFLEFRHRVNCVAAHWRRAAVLVLIGMLLCWPMQHQVQAAAGDLDVTFGSGGKVTTSFGGAGDEAFGVAIQSDGKIIAAGSAISPTPFLATDFALARYNTDGALDSSFGVGGKVTTDFFGFRDEPFAVAIQPDGKIVVAGIVEVTLGQALFGLARYNGDGSLDASFGSGGRVTTDFFGFGAMAHAIAVLPGGKILAAGTSSKLGTGPDFALARYDSGGALDPSFGIGGKTTTDFGGHFDRARSIVIQPGGKIIAAGATSESNEFGAASDFALARYNNDGSLDASFGTAGRIITDFSGSQNEARGVAVQPDDKIIAAGYALFEPNTFLAKSVFALVRYNSNGSLDSSFGSGGKVTTDFGCNGDASAVVIQPDGKIVAGGGGSLVCIPGRGFGFALARYNGDGVLDSSFGVGGKTLTAFSGIIDLAHALAIQPDGKIVACGLSLTPVGTSLIPRFALARYNGESFDICLQDESSGSIFQLNSNTGSYQFTNCGGVNIGGIGVLVKRGGSITLQDFAADRKVVAKIDTAVNKGSAGIQIYSQGATFTITDRNTTNNTCACR